MPWNRIAVAIGALVIALLCSGISALSNVGFQVKPWWDFGEFTLAFFYSFGVCSPIILALLAFVVGEWRVGLARKTTKKLEFKAEQQQALNRAKRLLVSAIENLFDERDPYWIRANIMIKDGNVISILL